MSKNGRGTAVLTTGFVCQTVIELIVAEVGAKRLIQIDPKNGAVTEIVGNLPIGLVAAPGGLPTNIPTGLGVGASGTIYFSSDVENAIYKITKRQKAQ